MKLKRLKEMKKERDTIIRIPYPKKTEYFS